MSIDTFKASDEEVPPARERDRWIGVYIGILAVILAVAAMGGDNAAKDATLRNIEATNTWSFFQAKNLRRQIVRTHVDDLEVLIETTPGLTAEGLARLKQRIADGKAYDAKLTSDPASGEGLDQLFERGKKLEKIRDRAMAQDPYFDYGQALLQIAIVLASVAIISGGVPLLVLSVALGAGGALMTLNGYLMFFTLPGLGT
ncbi:MAG: DUF4337 domain-containing protein [Hyphomicrobiaceae bacterium]